MQLNRIVPLQIDITNACNLACEHCYHSHHKNDGAIKIQDWINALKDYRQTQLSLSFTPDISICGGEPTLSPILFPILSEIHKIWGNDVDVSILTNGTILKNELLDYLTQHPRTTLQISLDGPSSKIHDSVRGKGAFQRTVRNIILLKSKGVHISAMATLGVHNYEQIPAYFEMASKLKLDEMNFTRFVNVGSGKESNIAQSLSPAQLFQSFREIIIQSAQFNVQTKLTMPLMHLIHPVFGSSGRFHEGWVIDYQGNFLATSRSRIKVGHISTHSFEDILLKDELRKNIRNGQIEECGTCPDYLRCGGDRNIAYASTGNFLGKDPGCFREIVKEKKEPIYA